MDYNVIENEISNFNNEYFKILSQSVEINTDFIESNKLFISSDNYMFTLPFLMKTFKSFKIIDPNFTHPLLQELNDDLTELKKLYDEMNQDNKVIANIFNNEFLKYSPTLNRYNEIILQKEDSSDLKNKLMKLQHTFYTSFKDNFYNDKKDLLDILKIAINTKSFYFDRLLFKKSKESLIIIKHLQIRKLEKELSSKSYIEFISLIMRPYTSDYKFLQKCLKVYK